MNDATGRVAAIGLVGISAVVVLTGCGSAVSASSGDSGSSSGATGTAAPSASASPTLSGEIGVATFSGSDGTAGTIRVTAGSGDFALTSDDLLSPTVAGTSSNSISVVGALDPIDPTSTCFDTGIRLSFGGATPGTPYKALWSLSSFDGDPTLIDQLVLTSTPEPGSECLAPVLAIADIDWSIEPLRSGLVALDSGPRPAATGDVTESDGAPGSYTVAPDDLIDDVAARFGMTADDLRYLNPLRARAGDLLRIDEELNLTVAGR